MSSFGIPDLDPALEANLATGMQGVEHLLREHIKGDYPLVEETSRHLVAAGGKRLRPLLTLISSHYGDPTRKEVIPAAVVCELTHLATLYHDDVMDEAPLRRGVESANNRWGNTIAILTGDYLFSKASDLLADLGPEAVRLQARTFERLVIGQIMETQGPQNGEDPLAHYLRVVGDKTGSLIATRYGNVMGTRGSVIPLFFNQLKNSLDLTVTNLKMSRFLMSVEESVELVLYALKNAKSGDIFVQKSPACTIEILIKALSKILNKNPKLKVIGMRHGEKEHETLISSEEMFKTIDLGKYFRIPQDTRDLNYEEYFEKGNKKNIKIISKDYSSCNTKQLSILETIKLINKSKVLVNFID